MVERETYKYLNNLYQMVKEDNVVKYFKLDAEKTFTHYEEIIENEYLLAKKHGKRYDIVPK